MKRKIFSEIDKRIKSKESILRLIKKCYQEEDQKSNVIIFKAQITELKSFKKFVIGLK